MKIAKSETFSDYILTLLLQYFYAVGSSEWNKWVLDDLVNKNSFHRDTILKNGETNFADGVPINHQGATISLSTDELALLHTYYYIEMHHYSMRRCLAAICNELMPVLRLNPLVIDFGCGASTAGLTLADWYYRNDNSTQFLMEYWGIDLSTSMLNLGEQLMVDAPLIHSDSDLYFSTKIDDIAITTTERPVLLIFSYVMAHEIDINTLANWIINNLLCKFSVVYILNQNSITHSRNTNWDKLVKLLQASIPQIIIYTETLNYSFSPDARIPWKNGINSVGFSVKLNYICYVNTDNNDTTVAV